jgi:hypothetical protein
MVNSLKTKLSSLKLSKSFIIGITVMLLSNVQASAGYQADSVPALDVSKIRKHVDVSQEKKLFDYIKAVNTKVKDIDAAKMAVAFIKAKKEFPNVKTSILVTLIKSESTFDKSAKHSIKAVLGVGGVYTKYWSETLREAGIIRSNKDLMRPEVNIRATAFILNYYLEQEKGNTRKALTAYKGVSKLGRAQANNVLSMSQTFKSKVRV